MICSKLRTSSRSILRSRFYADVGHIQGMDIRARIQSVIDENPQMSVRGVSLAAGLSDSALHKFLSGATESITLKTVEKLARALEVDERWLAYGEGGPERASEVAKIFDQIAEDQRAQALAILETFAKTGTHG